MSELPKGWAKALLAEVLPLSKEKIDPTKSSRNTYIGLEHIAGNGIRALVGSGVPADVKSAKNQFVVGNILYGKLRPYLNKVWRADRNGICSTDIFVLKPSEIASSGFFERLLTTREVVEYAASQAQGINLPRVNFAALGAFTTCVPPIAEQHRIVAKLEACEARIGAARAALDEVPKLLEQYRQGVLAAAFRGDLTRDWRAANPDIEPIEKTLSSVSFEQSKTGRAASSAVIDGLAAIAVGRKERAAPKGWKWVPLLDVARMESGHTPSRSHAEWWGGNIPWMGIRDARQHHGKAITSTLENTNELGLANSASRLLPAGTVCLSRTASVGYAVKMGFPMATSQDFANWICSDALCPDYLLFALLAEGENLRRFGKGTTHTTIYFPELKAFQICLPPVAEQKRIAKIAANALQVIDKAESAVSDQRKQLTTLTQSLLGKAFRGELVPQDPNDEPAGVLLARLRKEREEAEGAGKRPDRKTPLTRKPRHVR